VLGNQTFFGRLSLAGGVPINTDAWDGFEAERHWVAEQVRDRGIDNVVILTGDLHSSYAIEVARDPSDPRSVPRAVEFMTPSVTSENFDEFTHLPAGTVGVPANAVQLAANPWVKYADAESHGYVILDLTAERARAEFWYVDRTQPSTAQRLASAWQVASGSARLTAG